MTNQEIIDNAPEGWTHYSDNGVYYRIKDGIPEFYYTDFVTPYWLETQEPNLTRSRADIERIVELENTLHDRTISASKRIVELEQEIESYKQVKALDK